MNGFILAFVTSHHNRLLTCFPMPCYSSSSPLCSLLSQLRASMMLLASILLVSACSTNNENVIEIIVEEPVHVLYDRALTSYQEGNLGLAAEQFQDIELQHPYSEWASKAQLMAGYALYQKQDYNAAILVFDRYVEFNPDSNDRDYAEYMAALCYYEQIVDVGRDQFLTRQAADRFLRLIEQFPDSVYAKDVRIKYDLTQDQLAAKHMDIGRFYQQRLLYSGAIRRFNRVIRDYNGTTHMPEALFRLSESKLALGLHDDAQMAAAVLGYNYPESRWYRKAYDLLKNRNLAPSTNSNSWLNDFYNSLTQ